MKNLVPFIALSLGIGANCTAQSISSDEIVIAPMVAISVEGNISTVKEGERLTLKAKGLDELSSLQWQVSTDNKTWQNIPKATGEIYETLPIVSSSYFRATVSPLEGNKGTKIETISNVQYISLESNMASTKKKKE